MTLSAEKSAPPERSSDVLLLTTEQKVHGFVLEEIERIALGRHSSNDLCFDSRNVSNYHAEIVREETGLWLRDLRSTNGTYVNEERVSERRLANGDCIRVGSHEVLVELTSAEPSGEDSVSGLPPLLREGTFSRARPSSAGAARTGRTLAEVLVDLANSARSFRLVLTRNELDVVTVYGSNGRVVYAENGRAWDEKALYRAFEWSQGRFRVEPFSGDELVPRRMTIPIETLVAEGEQEAAALDGLIEKLPPSDVPLRLREASKTRICDLSPAELTVFQALIRLGTLERVVEELAMTDLRIMSTVYALLQKNVFEVEERSSLLEQTRALDRV